MRIRRFLFGLLRAKPSDIAGETYSAMVDRQDGERLSYQGNCKHENLSYKYSPFEVCADCQKTLREMSPEELEGKRGNGLFKINEELKEFGVRFR